MDPLLEVADRRSFLGSAALASLLMWDSSVAFAEAPPSLPSAGLTIREREPENLEYPFASLNGPTIDNELFYVRNHFGAPTIDVKKWKLRIEGAVDNPRELSYEDLLKLKATTLPATLECAGNGRVFLTPKAKGVNWVLGAVGNAEWTGVPLAAILDMAGPKKGAAEVVLVGADKGEVKDDPKSPGVIHFARSLPLAKAQKPEVLLAYRMNGKDLPPAHGYPVRALVPGWYGMASVKWLERIVVLDRPFGGYYQTMSYTYFQNVEGLPSLLPITEMQVKSQIARPVFQELVPARSTCRVFGAAWSGESEIAKVEISADGGSNWATARLLEKPAPFCWRLWEYDWHTPASAGKVKLMSRATDDKGRTQPLERNTNLGAYMIHHVLPVEVIVH